jgi:hypothetical protein
MAAWASTKPGINTDLYRIASGTPVNDKAAVVIEILFRRRVRDANGPV